MMKELSDVIARHIDLGAAEDQQQLIMLLKEAQEICGGSFSQDVLTLIADALDMREPALRALIRRIPALNLAEAPHRLEICGTCRDSRTLREYIEKRYSVKSGDISPQGGFAYYVTGCMHCCHGGPNIRWDGKMHCEADIALLDNLLKGF